MLINSEKKVFPNKFLTNFRFSLENSLAKNLSKCCLPAGSSSSSSIEKAHRRTRRWGISYMVLSSSQNSVQSEIQGLELSGTEIIGSNSEYCWQQDMKLQRRWGKWWCNGNIYMYRYVNNKNTNNNYIYKLLILLIHIYGNYSVKLTIKTIIKL